MERLWKRLYERYHFRRAIKEYRLVCSAAGFDVSKISNLRILLRIFRISNRVECVFSRTGATTEKEAQFLKEYYNKEGLPPPGSPEYISRM